MNHRHYEVWRYSNSWKKWVRDIYRDPVAAQARYEFLVRRGRKARAPQPFNSGLPITERIGFVVSRILHQTRNAARASARALR
jgi:hypothetical protein